MNFRLDDREPFDLQDRFENIEGLGYRYAFRGAYGDLPAHLFIDHDVFLDELAHYVEKLGELHVLEVEREVFFGAVYFRGLPGPVCPVGDGGFGPFNRFFYGRGVGRFPACPCLHGGLRSSSQRRLRGAGELKTVRNAHT